MASILESLGRIRSARLPAVVLFIVCCSIGSFHYFAFNSLPDAASATQSFFAIWQHGLGAANSLERIPVFGVHFWPMGLIGMPLFVLTKSYLGLVLTQSLVVALSTFPAYRIAVHLHGRQAAGKAVWLWALNPAVIGPFSGWGEGWQPLVLALLPILWSVYFFLVGRTFFGMLAFVSALLLREDVALSGLAIALFLFLWTRRGRFAASLAAFSLLWVCVQVFWLLPWISGREWIVWGYISSNLEDTGLLGSPSLIEAISGGMRQWIRPISLSYLCYWILLFGIRERSHWIFALPASILIFVNMTMETWVTRLPMLHYSASIAPFLFLALTEGMSKRSKVFRWQITGFCLGWLLLVGWNGKLLINAKGPATWEALGEVRDSSLGCKDLAMTNPRGGARFARGQELSWINKDHPWSDSSRFSCVIIDLHRKSAGAGWLSTVDASDLDAKMAGRGYSLRLSRQDIHLWKSKVSLE